MESTSISHLKAYLSRYISIVKTGEDIIITDRGNPIAKIVPIKRSNRNMNAHLKELERTGIIKFGSGKIPGNFWDMPRWKDQNSMARRLLRKERDESK